MIRAYPGRVWFLATVALAPLAGFVYFLSEWLFFVTKPSMLAALPLGGQVAALVRAPLPLVAALAALQAAASALSVVGYPRWRAVALVPPAVVTGTLLLILVDNFTYTLFGFGVLTADGAVRLLYAALWPALVVLAGTRLQEWVARHATRVAYAIAPIALLLLAGMPVGTPIERRLEPDTSAPPPVERAPGAQTGWPNILFLGIDGVDATAMSAYGAERRTTPFLDRLKDESLFFEHAFSNAGRTHGSLVALLTGRLPFSTHVTYPPTILQGDDAHRHLPGILKGLGYTTLQLGMRHYADAEDANLQGFDAANYRWQQLDAIGGRAAVDETGAFRGAVLERLDARLGRLFGFRYAVNGHAHVEGREENPFWRDDRRVDTLVRYFGFAHQPWFVHAHLLDTHCCSYHPRRLHFDGISLEVNARDSQLKEADGHLRRIIESLAAAGQLERTIVVISSDHTNGWTTTGRVPLLMRFPGARVRGTVRANVQLADVAPTVLDYLGRRIPEWMDGISLLEPERVPDDRPIFGVSRIAERETVAPYFSALRSAGPPNYGTGTVTLISGGSWFELDLADGALESGPVAGHARAAEGGAAAPGEADRVRNRARRLLERQVTAAGFTIGGGTTARYGQRLTNSVAAGRHILSTGAAVP